MREIKIVLEPDIHKSQNGGVFENLMRLILEKLQYTVTPNVHITGLEIDLFATNNLTKQILYAECKAKEKPKSTEIKNFVYSIDYGVNGEMADFGFFIHTEELDKQAAGLKLQIEKNKKNITFLGPEKIMKLLEDQQIISPFKMTSIEGNVISKLTLAVTYFGYYYIVIIQEGSVPKYYSVYDKNIDSVSDPEILKKINASIKDIQDLEFLSIGNSKNVKQISVIQNDKDTITEIRESENWFDYTPASIKHFIGRLQIRRDIKSFIESVRTNRTNNRIFFIDGKSGWGKSSLIAELKGSSKSKKFWLSRMFVLAIDTRSANTVNFVGLAFKKLVTGAIESGFINSAIFTKELSITSPFSVLDDSTVKELFSNLKKEKKVLVLVFDQFEDKFRNENIFDAFYKFFLDVNELKENLVVGFSWKSETNIPFGNPSYFKFNQLKDYSTCITVPEFNQKDAKQVVQQLEKTIGMPIGNDLERRLIISSQGYPWLIKKLCIHTLNQYNSGKTIEELLEEELNYKDLFQKDLLDLDPKQTKILVHIAKRAYDGNPYDISETDEETQELLNQLVNKRLVIRTGTTYNIYWDIFRDYIVTGEIPVLGESYLIRASGNTCLDAFLTFNNEKKLSIENIIKNYSKVISEKAILNILLELRSIGLIRKIKGENTFEITEKVTSVNKDFFEEYITKKFQNYTPYLELLKLDKVSINIDDLKIVLKSIFKTENFEEMTWDAYAKNLFIWFKLSRLKIKDKLIESKKGRSVTIADKYEQVPYYSPNAVVYSYNALKAEKEVQGKKWRDLILLGLIDENENIVEVPQNLNLFIVNEALKFTKINEAFITLKSNPRLSQSELLKLMPQLVSNFNAATSKKQIISVIFSWAKFCLNIQEGKNINPQPRRYNEKNYFYSFGPNHTLSTINDFSKNLFELNANNNKKLRDLERLGFFSFENKTYKLTLAGNELLKAQNKGKYISDIAVKDENLKRFLQYYDSKFNSIKTEKIIEKEADFFSNLSSSSKKLRCSIYLAWVKYIRLHENASL